MLEVAIDKYKYVRLICEQITEAELKALRQKYDYVFLVFYGSKPEWAGFEILERQSPIIDLTQPIEEIFHNFNAATRNQIRKLDKVDGLKFVSLDQNFEQIYQVYQKFELERNWIPTLKDEFVKHYIFTAYFQDKLISAVTCYAHDGVLRVARIFSTRLEENSELKKGFIAYASRRVFFEICKYAKANNYHKFDLSGVNFTDPTKAGLTRFKQSFGGPITDVYVCKYMTEEFRQFKDRLKLNKIDLT